MNLPEVRTETFHQLLRTRLSHDEAAASHAVEPLAHLHYEHEVALKNECFLELWRQRTVSSRMRHLA